MSRQTLKQARKDKKMTQQAVDGTASYKPKIYALSRLVLISRLLSVFWLSRNPM